MQQKYVLGFAFNDEKTHVVLIRKNRPDWMAGKLNGIGGKVETNEIPAKAMSREFREEAGIEIKDQDWFLYGIFNEKNERKIFCYKATVDIDNVSTETDEDVVIIPLDQLHKRKDIIKNVPWLVHMALANTEHDSDPNFITMDFYNTKITKLNVQKIEV